MRILWSIAFLVGFTLLFSSPVFWYYLSILGPEWYTEYGWVENPKHEFAHIPSWCLVLTTEIVLFCCIAKAIDELEKNACPYCGEGEI